MKKWITLMAVATIAATGALAQDATYLATPEWLGDQEVIVNDWNEVEPYGWIYPFEAEGWTYHDGLGFLYPFEGSSFENTWFYSPLVDYVWSGNGVFPYLYLNSPGSFFFWLGEGEEEGSNWWFNFAKGVWLEVPATFEPAAE